MEDNNDNWYPENFRKPPYPNRYVGIGPTFCGCSAAPDRPSAHGHKVPPARDHPRSRPSASEAGGGQVVGRGYSLSLI